MLTHHHKNEGVPSKMLVSNCYHHPPYSPVMAPYYCDYYLFSNSLKGGILLTHLPYNLYCVGGDVKHCSLIILTTRMLSTLQVAGWRTKITNSTLQWNPGFRKKLGQVQLCC